MVGRSIGRNAPGPIVLGGSADMSHSSLQLKVCRRCLEDIRQARFSPSIYYLPEIVEESRCEFWAHGELRRITKAFERQAETIPDREWE